MILVVFTFAKYISDKNIYNTDFNFLEVGGKHKEKYNDVAQGFYRIFDTDITLTSNLVKASEFLSETEKLEKSIDDCIAMFIDKDDHYLLKIVFEHICNDSLISNYEKFLKILLIKLDAIYILSIHETDEKNREFVKSLENSFRLREFILDSNIKNISKAYVSNITIYRHIIENYINKRRSEIP